MKNRVLLNWITLGILLAACTNGQLFLHLWGCHHNTCDGEAPHAQRHNSQDCPICQVLLIYAGKYTLQPPTAILRIATVNLQSPLLCEEKYSQINCSIPDARGPPTA